MKRLLFFFLLVIQGVLLNSAGTTYYIRTDGGTASQCNGTIDAPYPGTGSNQPCAWSHPFWALDSNGNWKIQGGDTIIIAAGSYMMGYGAPNTSGWCDVNYTYDCDLPPLPSGPDASNPTRILGKGWDSNCSNPPELWGTQRPWNILDLTGSSNVYIGCLEITDHSGCVEDHSNPSASCERDTYPYGDWASEGLVASDSANVTLKNLDIHGLASTGIRAGRISNWTVEDVRVAGNGWVGWEGDIDGNDSNSGTLSFKNFIVEWNGCGETYPGEQPHNCWAQDAGGYGDCLGTGATGGHWIFQDCIFRYNTSDGLDLLYARNPGSQIEIKRTMAYGNAGNAIKVNGDTSMENCLMVGNCGFFHGKSFTYNVDDCRALGSPLSFSLRKGTTFSMVNSTIVGQGDCLMGGECDDGSCDGSEKIIIKNNAFQGYPDYLDPSDTTCYLWLDRFNFYNIQMDYNIVYKTKIADELTLAAHDLQQNPLFVNDSLASFDGHLQEGSPAIDSGLVVGSLNGLIPADDIEGNSRPKGAGVDRGAYEYGSNGGGPQPQITLNRTQLTFGTLSKTRTDTQTFLVSNSGSGTLNWTASSDKSWLGCYPTSGTDSGVVRVTVTPSSGSSGTTTGTITITGPNASNSPRTVQVTLNGYTIGGSSPPFGSFDTPTDGATVRSSIPVTGWALDDVQISKVKIYREEGENNGALVFIGDAVFMEGARPDVEQSHLGYPFYYKAGWGYLMLTNFLPNQGNGTFTLHAIAYDKDEHSVTLGTKTIICDNASAVKPFGAIDTPTQGGTASGSGFVNWGWALTPQPNSIPTGGSTIDVFVDGVNLGHPTYNNYRADIAALFPLYANSNGAVGYFYLDTTPLANGVHTIYWTAFDNAGNTDGIGSRYFFVENIGSNRESSDDRVGREQACLFRKLLSQIPVDSSDPVKIIKGYKKNSTPQTISPDENGIINIQIKELEPVGIDLENKGECAWSMGHGAGKDWLGFQVYGDQLRALPVGSTLHSKRGIFYWQPGPGFLGEFPLVFIGKRESGEMTKKNIVIKIIPKF